MKISKKICQKILNDNEFSLELAQELKKAQSTIKAQATRESKELIAWKNIEFYIKKGFDIDEIFDRPITSLLKK